MEKKFGKGISLLSYFTLYFSVSGFLLSVSAEHSSTCQVGWETNPVMYRCYMYVPTPQNWYNSEKVCNDLEGHLAVLTSAQDLNFTRSLCTSSSGCWVRAHGYNISAVTFSGWHQSISATCTGSNCSEACGLIFNGRDTLVEERCNTSHGLICMKDHGENKSKEYMLILAIVSGLILVITLAVIVWLLVYRRSKRKRRSRNASSPSMSALVPPLWRVFTSEEVRLVTKNFSEGSRLPGNAKTGGTYSGVLPDGSRVAIKRLKRSSLQRKKEFYSEIGRVARLHHPNLVAVKGCCYDHGERYIVYEFVPNGPLDKWLHHVPRGGRILDWGMRMRVATSLAQGIA